MRRTNSRVLPGGLWGVGIWLNTYGWQCWHQVNFSLSMHLEGGNAILARKALKLRLVGRCKLSGDRFEIRTDFF